METLILNIVWSILFISFYIYHIISNIRHEKRYINLINELAEKDKE